MVTQPCSDWVIAVVNLPLVAHEVNKVLMLVRAVTFSVMVASVASIVLRLSN